MKESHLWTFGAGMALMAGLALLFHGALGPAIMFSVWSILSILVAAKAAEEESE